MLFNSVFDMIDEINDTVLRTVRETMEPCKAEDLGLDRRAGYALFVNEDFIAVEGDGHMLDYYGGFEYVDSEYVTVIGDFKFYSAGDRRVKDHIDRFFERESEEEEIE
jgi:hypothetical protein